MESKNSDQESGMENICYFAETLVYMPLFYVQEITVNNKKKEGQSNQKGKNFNRPFHKRKIHK